MGFFEKSSIFTKGIMPKVFKLSLIIAIIAISLLITSCGDDDSDAASEPDEDKINKNLFLGYINVNSDQDNALVDYSIIGNKYNLASSIQFCKLADNIYHRGACAGKAWDECGFWDFKMRDFFYFTQLDNETAKVTCSQRGIFDTCSPSDYSSINAKIRLCDSNESDKNCTAGINEILIDLNKQGYDIDCTRLFALTSGADCAPSDFLILYHVNDFQPCDPYNDELVCVWGKCTKYVCIPNNKLDPYELCDPKAQLFNLSGREVSGTAISCQDFSGVPSTEGGKPICRDDCTPDISECTLEPGQVLCQNNVLESFPDVGYTEVCEWGNGEEYYLHPDGTQKEKQYIFKTQSFCAQQEGYIGDASNLECDACTEINYDNCLSVQLTKPKEENCGNGLNDDYWYDLYIEGDNRTEYIAENYLDEYGYFEDYKFDTTKCFSETNCSDCHDVDCDGRVTFGNNYCNFKTERMCNDNFDNDGDGLIDEQDSDCSFERYNPDLSLKGLCDAEEKCFDESELECIDDSAVFTKNNKAFICNEGNWINEIKLISALSYAKLKNQQSLVLYCNDPADFTTGKSYVIELNSKIRGTQETVSEFIGTQEQANALYGKFCAAKSDDEYLLGTILKNKNEIHHSILLFYPLGTICDGINKDAEQLQRCNNTQMFMNYKTGIVLKTNIFSSDQVELFNGINEIDNKIKELKKAGGQYLVTNSLEDLEKTGDIEAFALKKNEDKELLGIIAKVNSTWYSIVYIKNVPSFAEICKSMTLNIASGDMTRTVTCKQEIGTNNFVIAWTIPTEQTLIYSKAKFDELVKEIRI